MIKYYSKNSVGLKEYTYIWTRDYSLKIFYHESKWIKRIGRFLGRCSSWCSMWCFVRSWKGTDTRNRIAEVIRKRGIKLNSKDMESLVDDIADELQPANDWCNTTQESGKALYSLCGSPFLDSILLQICFLLTKYRHHHPISGRYKERCDITVRTFANKLCKQTFAVTILYRRGSHIVRAAKSCCNVRFHDGGFSIGRLDW